jgi:hypothetical protein
MCQSNTNVIPTEKIAIIDGKERLNPLLFISETKIRLWAVLLGLFPPYLFVIFFSIYVIYQFIVGIIEGYIWLIFIELVCWVFLLLAIGAPFLLFRFSIKKQKKRLSKVPEDAPIWSVYNRLSNRIRKEVGYIPELWYSKDDGPPRVLGTNKKAIIVLPEMWAQKLETYNGMKELEACLLHELSHVMDKDLNVLVFTRQFIKCYCFVMTILCIYVPLALVFNIDAISDVAQVTVLFILLGGVGYGGLFLSAQRKRELRADFRTMVIQKTSRYIKRLFAIWKGMTETEPMIREKQQMIKYLLSQLRLYSALLPIGQYVNKTFSRLTHPSEKTRRKYLNHSNEYFFQFDVELAIMLAGLRFVVAPGAVVLAAFSMSVFLGGSINFDDFIKQVYWRFAEPISMSLFYFNILLIFLAANASIIKSSKFHPLFTKPILYFVLARTVFWAVNITLNIVSCGYADIFASMRIPCNWESILKIFMLLLQEMIFVIYLWFCYTKISHQYVQLYSHNRCLQSMGILAIWWIVTIGFQVDLIGTGLLVGSVPFIQRVITKFTQQTMVNSIIFLSSGVVLIIYYLRLRLRSKPRCQCKTKPIKAICPTCGKPLYDGWLVTESMAWAVDNSQDVD